ncbi:SA1320 family protein [Gemella cuniculi]|uniref:SA1320 family protein n=1 Tax=Gemella cuniculi TaxID=150240 RepID=UPI0004177ADE|nr:DUF2974 domain-containing protein [Gemella cuniculi]
MKYTDKENVEIAKREYDDNSIGFQADVNGKYYGTLSDINNNRSNNGEQIYTYTKKESGEEAVSPDAPLSERAKVKEITVLYRGSTSPTDISDGKWKDAVKDWLGNDLPLFKRISLGERGVTGQLEASSEYLKEIMEKYPNAKVNVYGHSLGSMDAQYALANVTDYERINSAYIYNGPNIYSLLSYNQKLNVSALYSKIHNYVDSKDFIGFAYEKGYGTVGQVYKFEGKNLSDFAKQHIWGGYDFDEEGNLIDKDGNRVKVWNKPKEIAMLEKIARSQKYAELIKKENSLMVDVDQDGKLDASFDGNKLAASPLIPYNTSTGEIVINYFTLSTLSANLGNLLNDIAQIKELLKKSEETNKDVETRKQNRTQKLEESIVNYLEQINLIKSIKNLDGFYSNIEENKKLFNTLITYGTFQFSRQFDWFGASGSRNWCYQNGTHWDYGDVERKLQRLKVVVFKTIQNLNSKQYPMCASRVPVIITIPVRTMIAKKGEQLINSFKKSIDETFKGQNIRANFEDGIANPLGEVIKVEKTNIDNMEKCIQSMKQSVDTLANSHKQNDATIEQNWKNNQDVLGNYKVEEVPKDFNTFVEKSGVFDDLSVLQAFDKQVDDTTKALSDKMVKEFSNYLSIAKNKSRNTHTDLKDTQTAADATIADFPTGIYYKNKKENDDEIHYYRTIEESIEVSSTIRDVTNFVDNIEEHYQETIRTIDHAAQTLPTLKTQLRVYLEEAIYNYTTISSVITGQKVIATLMNKIYLQALNFSTVLKQNKGKSIEALDGRMQEMGIMASHISELIEKCFGNNGEE